MSANTALQHLHLSSPSRVLSTIEWIPSILARINTPNLRTLHFTFAQSRQFHLDRPFLKVLAQILEDPRFQKLQSIRFSAKSGRINPGDRCKEKIRECICAC